MDAYRPTLHTQNDVCLRWNRQLPACVRDWMLVWAVEEGSEASIERASKDEGWALKEDACKDGMWKLRRDLKKEGRMCCMCEWFDEGPCSSNAIIALAAAGI